MDIGEKVLHSGFLFGAFLLRLAGPSAQQPQPQVQDIRLQVDMVSLPVLVASRDGKPKVGLKKDDFQILEDGVVQEIAVFALTDEPVSAALALDTSSSIGSQLPRLQNEAIHFVRFLHPDDSVAVLSFADDVNLLEHWSIDRDRNAHGIKESRPGYCTRLFEAVLFALEEVLKPVKERTALVLFTDGGDTASHRVSKKETIELARETRAMIYIIYFKGDGSDCGRANLGGVPGPPIVGVPRLPPGVGVPRCGSLPHGGRGYLAELAEYTGGRVLEAGQSEDLSAAFQEIARELSSQYSLAYYPTNTRRNGKFRHVQLKVNKTGLVARTKKGYYAHK